MSTSYDSARYHNAYTDDRGTIEVGSILTIARPLIAQLYGRPVGTEAIVTDILPSQYVDAPFWLVLDFCDDKPGTTLIGDTKVGLDVIGSDFNVAA